MKLKGVYESEGALWRLIHADEDLCCLYPLGSKGIKYREVPRSEFQSQLDSGQIKEATDPYLGLSAKVLSGASADRAQKRLEMMESLLSDTSTLYDKHLRAAAIKKISDQYHVSERHLYKLLSVWWERGQCPAALGPIYGRGSGRRNTKRKTGPQSGCTCAPPVDDKIRKSLEKAYAKYLLKTQPCTMPEAYRYFKADYMHGLRVKRNLIGVDSTKLLQRKGN